MNRKYEDKSANNELQTLFKSVENELFEVVDLVRKPQTKIHQITLGVLVVLEVHAKDVVESLVEKEISDPIAFDWLAQMRYYLENEFLEVKMVNTSRKYGYEYLGNQGRLVITPLTDRCYRTLMSALQMNLGGAPEGPAGTGKTETVKDLSKALAKHCVVFNCSDELNISAMTKFFKGLCCCGSWSCFDEFNRIELEVLSVIAQQVLTIQNAILKESTHKRSFEHTPTFTFEGESITLDVSCAVFITMNPGYQGRSELPDNLKALFRPVAMMIPNYAMISEISLYSYGFKEARELAIKITSSLKLSSEQLSSQSHYDFGMRAVKSIILAAGALKRSKPDESEELLVLKAIKDCNLPKFTNKDVPLFNQIMSDLFPKKVLPETDYGELKTAVMELTQSNHLEFNEYLETKIFELFETTQVRHGLMVVGKTLSAKSTIINILARSISLSNKVKAIEKIGETEKENVLAMARRRTINVEEMDPEKMMESKKIDYVRVNIHGINPKAVSLKMLYGYNDEASKEFHEGVAAKIFRDCAEDLTKNLNWILFDGPVDAHWIENMNTVLDDNKKLCLPNSETIRLTEQIRILFEVEDLAEASPATVSRCGMVYMEPDALGWKLLFNPWMTTMPESMLDSQSKEIYRILIDCVLEPAMELLFSHVFIKNYYFFRNKI